MDWGIFRPSKPAAICLALLGFSFLLMTFRLTGAVKNFRTFLLYWISPIQEMSIGALGLISEPGDKFVGLVNAHRENVMLRERILKDSILETQYRETLEENRRLRAMLELKGSLPFSTLSA